MVSPRRVIPVILAAGGGTRWDGEGHKLLAPLRGRSVVEHAMRAATASGLGPVIVVTGAVEIPIPEDLIDQILPAVNPRWNEGQSTSLAVAVQRADELGGDAIAVGLGDQPGITPAAWNAVALSASSLAVATYGDRRGHPVLIAREHWGELPDAGDLGARDLLRRFDHAVQAIPCDGSTSDIDTTEDLTPWQN